MKKILSLALLLSVTASAFAVEAEINGLWYELISKAKEAKVIQYKNNVRYSGNIVIPKTVEYNGTSYSVTSIGQSAFSGCSGLTSVTIPNSVTSIGSGAFYNCSSLTSVHISDIAAWCNIAFVNNTSSPFLYAHRLYLGEEEITDLVIPNSVTSIGDWAFFYCSGLTSVTIPNSVTSIGEKAFEYCSGLTSVTIGNSVTTIGESAFEKCSSLTSITIPNSVTSIGEWAFYCCSGMTSVTIGNSVTSIGYQAFASCSGLTSITIPNSVTSIGYYAFCGCSALTTITIGSGVETIYWLAFAYCPELTDVYCYAEIIPTMKDYYGNSCADAFDNSHIENATLHVPTASIDAYKAVEPWKNFKAIVALPEKCSSPTIAFVDGELEFNCETEGVEYIYNITNNDVKSGKDSKVKISGTYTVSVYATKENWDNSDVVTKEFTIGPDGDICDVNRDGVVDVADIGTIIDRMAEQ